MAEIEKDGVYKNEAGDHFQFRAGQDVGDVKFTYVAPFPKPGQPFAEGKAAAAPENKAEKAAENK